MSKESDGSDLFAELFGVGAASSPMSGSTEGDQAKVRRLTTVFVVDPSEMSQLGWYHTLYHLDDFLLVGTSGSHSDAVKAVSEGWADLVLIDADTDSAFGLLIESELLDRPVNSRYLFTSAHPDAGDANCVDMAHDSGSDVQMFTRLATNGPVESLVRELRLAVEKLFNHRLALLHEQGLSTWAFPDPGRIEAKLQGDRL